MKEETKNREFKNLKNADEIIAYLDEKALNHTYYCHYSSVYNIDSIIDKGYFRLSRLSDCNDRTESQNKFALCFSATFSENIPMWYLYGGIDGKGARIALKKKAFRSWLERVKAASIKLVEYADKECQKMVSETDLDKNDYTLEYGDVLYISSDKNGSNTYRAKHNNSAVFGITKDNYDRLYSKRKDFIKALPWFYEKEFRLVVTLNKTSYLEMLKQTDSKYRLIVSLDDEAIKNMQIRLGPESEDESLPNMPGIKKYLWLHIEKSDHNKEIKMNLTERLCKKCKDRCKNPDNKACEKIAQH